MWRYSTVSVMVSIAQGLPSRQTLQGDKIESCLTVSFRSHIITLVLRVSIIIEIKIIIIIIIIIIIKIINHNKAFAFCFASSVLRWLAVL